MKTRTTMLLTGLLFLALSAPALAHDPGYGGYYPDPRLSGGVTVWGNSQGYAGWSGALTIGAGSVYVPVYAPWVAAHRHGPQCAHGMPSRHAKAYRKGYRHGSRDAYRADHDRGHGHH